MSETSNVDKVWALAKEIGVCMFITYDGERQRARPMAAYIRPDEHAFYFLTDDNSAKTWQVDKFPIVSLAFSAPAKNDYVAVTGQAGVSNDRAKIRDIFNAFAKAWWDSPDDPAIRLVKVSPEDAEMWESANGPVATVRMLAAAVTGGRPDLGEHAKVQM